MKNSVVNVEKLVIFVILIMVISISLRSENLYQSKYDQFYLRGTFNSWSNTEMELFSDYKWKKKIKVKENSELKFDVQGDWSLNFGDNNRDGYVEEDGENIEIYDEGTYEVIFNGETGQYSITKLSKYREVYLRSSFNNWEKTLMDLVDIGRWRTKIYADPNTELKFDISGDWGLNFGDDDRDGYVEEDGENIIISDPGIYEVVLDSDSNQYIITKLSKYREVYIKGSFNEWTKKNMELTEDEFWRTEININSSTEFKFDIYGDWELNFGDNNKDGHLERDGENIEISDPGLYEIKFDSMLNRYYVNKIVSGGTLEISYEMLSGDLSEVMEEELALYRGEELVGNYILKDVNSIQELPLGSYRVELDQIKDGYRYNGELSFTLSTHGEIKIKKMDITKVKLRGKFFMNFEVLDGEVSEIVGAELRLRIKGSEDNFKKHIVSSEIVLVEDLEYGNYELYLYKETEDYIYKGELTFNLWNDSYSTQMKVQKVENSQVMKVVDKNGYKEFRVNKSFHGVEIKFNKDYSGKLNLFELENFGMKISAIKDGNTYFAFYNKENKSLEDQLILKIKEEDLGESSYEVTMAIFDKPSIGVVEKSIQSQLNIKRSNEDEIENILLGDFNADYKVDLIDLYMFAGIYNESYNELYDISPSEKGTGDWEGIYCTKTPDGLVDLRDFVIFSRNYRKEVNPELETKPIIELPIKLIGRVLDQKEILLEWDSIPYIRNKFRILKTEEDSEEHQIVCISTEEDRFIDKNIDIQKIDKVRYKLEKIDSSVIYLPKLTRIQDIKKTDKKVEFEWKNIYGATKYKIIRYGDETKIFYQKSNVFSDKTVIPGKEYIYDVSGICGNIESEPLKISPGKIPGGHVNSPKNFIALEKGLNYVKLSWDEVENARKYRIIRNSLVMETTDSNYPDDGNNIYLDRDLLGNTEYNYKIQAYDGYIWGDESIRLEVKTDSINKPNNLRCVYKDYQNIELKWDTVKGASKYTVKKYQVINGNRKNIETKSSNNNLITFSVDEDTGYYFEVRSHGAGDISKYSTSIYVHSLDGSVNPPKNFIALEKGLNYIKLSWDEVENARKYRIIRNSTVMETINPPYPDGYSNNIYIDRNLLGNTEYKYTIEAYNGYKWSDKSVILEIKTNKINIPTNLRCEYKDHQNIELKWDTVTGASKYTVKKYQVINGNKKNIETKSLNNNLIRFFVDEDTKYYFEVKSHGAGDISNYSSSINVRSLEYDSGTPPEELTPFELRPAAGGSTFFTFYWEEIPGVTKYTGTRVTSGRGGINLEENNFSNNNYYSDYSIDLNKYTYYYQVTAHLKDGRSITSYKLKIDKNGTELIK